MAVAVEKLSGSFRTSVERSKRAFGFGWVAGLIRDEEAASRAIQLAEGVDEATGD